MQGPQQGAVPGPGAEFRRPGDEFVPAYIPQDGPAEAGGYGLHLRRDGGVVRGQVGVAAAGVHDAEGVAGGGQVKIHLPDPGLRRIGKIDGHRAAGCAGHLVHQAAGLAEIDVFRLLADLGDLRGRPRPLAVQTVKNGAEEHFHRRRRGKSRAGQHRRGGVGGKTAHPGAPGGKLGGDAPHQGFGGAGFFAAGRQVRQVQAHVRVAHGPEDDGAVRPGRDKGHRVQLDGRGQHLAVIVVRMVAAQFGASRGGEHPQVRGALGKIPERRFRQVPVPLAGGGDGFRTVQVGVDRVRLRRLQAADQFGGGHWSWSIK